MTDRFGNKTEGKKHLMRDEEVPGSSHPVPRKKKKKKKKKEKK